MPQTINYKLRIKNIIQTLTKWAKKPTLDHEFEDILNEYHSFVNDGVLHFAECAIIIQACTTILEKRIDIICREFFELSMRLCSALRRPEEEITEQNAAPDNVDVDISVENIQVQQNVEPTPEDVRNKEKPPEKSKRKKKNKVEEMPDTSKKISIPGLPDEILESLNLTDCNINDVIQECVSKLTPAHPLYSVFAKIGDDISRTKNLITVNEISLSGKSWNVLYMLENLLKKNMPETSENGETPENASNVTENNTQPSETTHNPDIFTNESGENTLVCTQISENGVENITDMYEDNNSEEITHSNQDSSVNENAGTNSQSENKSSAESESPNNEAETPANSSVDTPAESSVATPESSVAIPAESSVTTPAETSTNDSSNNKQLSDAQLRKIVVDKCKIQLKDIKINLLRLPHSVLLKVDYFRLSSDYFTKSKKKKVEQKIKILVKPKVITRKRQREMEKECNELVKKLKTYDLDAFEEFCHAYNVSQGLCSPIPEKLNCSRKSIDNRSEMSYGCPVTPDSGRFSMSFHTDSEFEHTDFDMDHELDRPSLSRADSGCCLMSPPHESNIDSIDSALPFSSEPVPTTEDPTLVKLKEMFPNSFADPKRAEILKNLVRPPDKQGDSENYLEWKQFIDEKTAKEVEFNIHEYGSEILNTFPTKTKNEVISFKAIVQDKSVGDVARYFVSALQLTNTYNIEFCDERQGEVKAEGFNLKFLSDERHHEEFEDLNIPSQSQFFENLQSTSSGQTHNRHSTPYNTSQRNPTYHKVKRRRIDYMS